jgi:phage anti-repressor protein
MTNNYTNQQEIFNNKINAHINDPLFQKIHTELSFEQKDTFIMNFYSYLSYDTERDFVVDLDNIWQWLGYTRKNDTKKLLEKHFALNKDYQVFLSSERKQRGGHNKKQYLMNIKTFKKLCLKSDTKKAEDIHDYFLKMEEIMFDYTKEQLVNVQGLVTIKDQEILLLKQTNSFQLPFEPTPYQELTKDQTVYVFQQNGDKNPNLYKIGETTDLKKRTQQYKTGSSSGINIVFQYKTHIASSWNTLSNNCFLDINMVIKK